MRLSCCKSSRVGCSPLACWALYQSTISPFSGNLSGSKSINCTLQPICCNACASSSRHLNPALSLSAHITTVLSANGCRWVAATLPLPPHVDAITPNCWAKSAFCSPSNNHISASFGAWLICASAYNGFLPLPTGYTALKSGSLVTKPRCPCENILIHLSPVL